VFHGRTESQEGNPYLSPPQNPPGSSISRPRDFRLHFTDFDHLRQDIVREAMRLKPQLQEPGVGGVVIMVLSLDTGVPEQGTATRSILPLLRL